MFLIQKDSYNVPHNYDNYMTKYNCMIYVITNIYEEVTNNRDNKQKFHRGKYVDMENCPFFVAEFDMLFKIR